MAWLFDFKGRIDRKTYWFGCTVSLIVSIALLALWFAAHFLTESDWSWLYIAPLRAVTILPSVSLYVRRLRDAGRSLHALWFLLLPMAISVAGFTAFAFSYADYSAQIDQGVLNLNDYVAMSGIIAAMFGAGWLCGIPGPLQFLFAVHVGLKKSLA